MIEQKVLLITHHSEKKWFAMDDQDNAERYLKKCLLDKSFDTVYGVAQIAINPEDPTDYAILNGELLGIFEVVYIEITDKCIYLADHNFLCRFALATRRYSDLCNAWLDDWRVKSEKIEANDDSPSFFEEVQAVKNLGDASMITFLIQEIKARILSASRSGQSAIAYDITEYTDVAEMERSFQYLKDYNYRIDTVSIRIRQALGKEFSVKMTRLAKQYTADKNANVAAFRILINW